MSKQASYPIPTVEGLTLALVIAHYLLWWGLLNLYPSQPLLSVGLLGLCLAWHLSIQHELIHGHPTRIAWLNDLLGLPPISLIYPYAEFKRSHLQHHRNELLTIPGVDPESFFHSPERWQTMGRISRAFWWINMTLLGRLIIHPLRSGMHMVGLCGRQLVDGTAWQRWVWASHLVGVSAVLWCVHSLFTMPIWAYLIAVYLGHALISLRSFYEHRAEDPPPQRSVVVESGPFFQLLFLNNNFHAVHHRYPGLPWYQLRAKFRRERKDTLRRNGNFYFTGYAQWLRYLLRPVASPVCRNVPIESNI